jgi:hypothetical protein
MRILLSDGPGHLFSLFVGLDHTRTMALREDIEIVESDKRILGTVPIPVVHVQSVKNTD